MTRILTIIAVLFATPVAASECEYAKHDFGRPSLKYAPYTSCFNALNPDTKKRLKCEEKRKKEAAELKAKLDAEARAAGFENGEEHAAAKFYCFQIRSKRGCEEERKRLRCNKIINPIKGYVQPSGNSYDDLEMRIMQLDDEVEQLSNR